MDAIRRCTQPHQLRRLQRARIFNQLKIIEPRGRYIESYQLDIQDRVVAVVNIEGQVMSIDYGVGSFVKQTTRFDGTTVSNAYDQAGRLNYILYGSASVPLASVDYSYYPDGEIKTIADGFNSVSNSCDRLNRLRSVRIGWRSRRC